MTHGTGVQLMRIFSKYEGSYILHVTPEGREGGPFQCISIKSAFEQNVAGKLVVRAWSKFLRSVLGRRTNWKPNYISAPIASAIARFSPDLVVGVVYTNDGLRLTKMVMKALRGKPAVLWFLDLQLVADKHGRIRDLESLLTVDDKARVKIICQPIQNTSMEVFSDLESGDFLFIDSSHISRVGSDVNFLFFEVLPQIPVGTFVHFHDIFWPFEYPAEWIRQGTAWNESYLLHAFLMYNSNFEIVLWVPFCARRWPELIKERMPNYMNDTGAAIWIRRVR